MGRARRALPHRLDLTGAVRQGLVLWALPLQDLTRRVAAFEARINQDPCTVADRLWVKHHLDQSEEKLRFSK